MTLPSANIQEVAASPSLAPRSSTRSCVTFGCAADGPFTPTFIGNLDLLKNTFKGGPGMKSAAYTLAKTGASGIFIRLPATAVAATKTAVTKVGTGTSVITLTGTPNDSYEIKSVVVTGGTIGTSATIKVSLDGGETYGANVPLGVATTYLIPGTGVTINYGAGTVVAADYITASTTAASASNLPATLTRVDASTWTAAIAGAPVDAYEVLLEWLTGGTVGTAGATYRYSLDGGRTFLPETALGVDLTITLMDGTVAAGPVITLTSTEVIEAGDTLAWKTTAPEWQTADAVAALAVLRASKLTWSFLHGTGALDTGKFGGLDLVMSSWAAKTKFAWLIGNVRDRGQHEVTATWAARLVALWGSSASTRIALGAGYTRIVCPLTGRSNRRPVAWVAVPALISVPPQIDIAQKSLGALSADAQIHDADDLLVENDDRIDSQLSDARFLTLRTYDDEPGVFFTRGSLMSGDGDIARIADRRVLNIVEEVYQRALLQQLQAPFKRWGARAKAPFKPGDIHEADAKSIERFINSALQTQVADQGMVSGITCVLDRTPINLGAGKWRIEADVKINGLSYIDQATGRVGFVDPALDAIMNKAGS
jgi:hypothetical protein